MTRLLVVVLLAGGCGRLGFGSPSSDRDADSGDAAGSLHYSYIKASNPSVQDEFGYNIAVSGDGSTMAVGAPYEDGAIPGINASDGTTNSASDAGAVYVFVRTGSAWQQQAYIKPLAIDADDHFGFAVALSYDGSTLAIGAPEEDSSATGVGGSEASNAAADAGAVFVYTRTGTTWAKQAYLKAGNTDASDFFGCAVSLSATGDVLAIGAEGEDSSASGINGDPGNNGTLDSGAAYVFTRTGTSWLQQAYIKAWNPGISDLFGGSVALSGDGATLAIAAQDEDSGLGGIQSGMSLSDNNATADAGAVYVFVHAPTWKQQAYVKPSFVGFGGDFFGFSLALSDTGDVLASGSPGSDTQVANSGAVWTFRRTAGTWTEEQELKASNPGDNDQFSVSLALSGDGAELMVGAPFEDSCATGIDGNQLDDACMDAGAVYVFAYASGWSQTAYAKGNAVSPADHFGNSVAVSADHGTRAAAMYDEDSGATGIDGDPFDESVTNSGAVGVSYVAP